jgi:uncharacterized protein
MKIDQEASNVLHATALVRRYGQWALVTGASDGIGEAIARELSAQGMNLVLASRREAALNKLAEELRVQHGVQTQVVASDLQRHEANEALFDAIRTLDIGVFVAAAGFGTSGSFLQTNLDDELSMLDVNCRSVLHLTHLFAGRFAARAPRRSAIVLLSSLVAFQGVPRASNYAATKAYVQSLAEGLAIELAPQGVDVLAVAPGPVASGFAARANMTMAKATPSTEVARETIAALGRRRFIRPGGLSKFLGYSLATLPRWGRVQVMTKVMAGMTRHK